MYVIEMKKLSPIRPVITQPMVGVMLKRWVMVDASRSLSYEYRNLIRRKTVGDQIGARGLSFV